MLPALVEGHRDERLLKVLWRQLGNDEVPVVRDAGGGGSFWKLAERYNAAGHHRLVLGLADQEESLCVPKLLEQLGVRSPGFKLRIAVRMLESWLLADREAIASFLHVSLRRVPQAPDLEQHPKRTLVSIARRSSRRSIREALVPDGSGAVVGPEYTAVVGSFIDMAWECDRARRHSPSLERACTRWSEQWKT